MTTFENQQLFSTDIPFLHDLQLEDLPKAFQKKWAISNAIVALVLLSVFGVVYFTLQDEFHVFFYYFYPIVAVLIGLLFLIWPFIGYKYKQYAVREHDVIFQSGVIWRSLTVLPFVRVQHVEVRQGPIERMFGLARIVFFTAGGDGGDLKIPGLLKVDADKLRAFMVDKLGEEND